PRLLRRVNPCAESAGFYFFTQFHDRLEQAARACEHELVIAAGVQQARFVDGGLGVEIRAHAHFAQVASQARLDQRDVCRRDAAAAAELGGQADAAAARGGGGCEGRVVVGLEQERERQAEHVEQAPAPVVVDSVGAP